MQEGENQSWTLKNFLDLFNDPDQDHVFNALNEMFDYIQRTDYFKEMENGEVYIGLIINKILCDSRYFNDFGLRSIFEILMKLIPQFVTKLPIELVPTVYDLCLKNLSKPDINYFTILSAVLEKTIVNGDIYSLERKQTITNFVMTRLVSLINDKSTKTSLKELSVNLIVATATTFPNCFTPSMKNDVKNLKENLTNELHEIKDTETNEYLTLNQSLSSVSKAYAKLINDNNS